jgi:hypothetical protein
MGMPTLGKEGVGSMMSASAWQRPPPLPKDPSYVPPARDPNRPGPHIVAEVITLEGQVKLGRVQGFTVLCDEGAYLPGGTDSAPSPLGYFTAAIGF